MRDFLRAAAVIAGGIVLVAHFAFVTLYNAPPNPLSVTYKRVLTAYVDPYFTQNWNLFAPDPIDEDVFVLARYKHGTNGVASNWYNLSQTFTDAVRRNPPSGLDLYRESLTQSSISLINEHAGMKIPVADRSVVHPPIEMDILERTASALDPRPVHDGDFVQLALARHRFPRYNERFGPDRPSSTRTTYFPWKPIARDVVAVHVLRT